MSLLAVFCRHNPLFYKNMRNVYIVLHLSLEILTILLHGESWSHELKFQFVPIMEKSDNIYLWWKQLLLNFGWSWLFIRRYRRTFHDPFNTSSYHLVNTKTPRRWGSRLIYILTTRMLISTVSRFICRCLSSFFKELWPLENCKMYRNALKIHFSNCQNSLENVSISLKLSWQMLLWILWNSQKIDSRL